MHATGSAHYPDVPTGSVIPSRSCQVTLPLFPPADTHLHTHAGHSERKQSIPSPGSGQRTKGLSPAPKIVSSTIAVHDTPETRSEIFEAEHVLGEVNIDLQQRHSPGAVPCIPKTPASPHPLDGQLGKTPESVQWEATGRGREIKRVQVIFSSDRADGLIVEAKLLRRLKKNFKSAAERAQDPDGDRFSESSGQVLF